MCGERNFQMKEPFHGATGHSRQSRIDVWLLSSFVEKDKITVNFLATPLTDHIAIHINIQLLHYYRRCTTQILLLEIKQLFVKA